MAQIMKGAPVAAALCEKTAAQAAELARHGVEPCLAIVRMGEEGGDLAYERAAVKRCAGLGIRTETAALPRNAEQAALLAEIDRVNRSADIHGCLLLRPLPEQIDEYRVCQALAPEKDVDCVTDSSLALAFTGRGRGFLPCTPQAVMELLDYYGVALRGARAAVIGRSLVVGRPLAMLLQARDATVTLCHSRTRDLAAICREQDILIAAAGRADMVDGGFIKPGQIVVDVGTSADSQGRLRGDVAFDQAEPLAGGITPVPGGVGAVTSSVLASHVVLAAARQTGVQIP